MITLPSDIVIRPLAEADADLYRALRLEALRDSPDSFSASIAEEEAISDEEMVRRAAPDAPSVTFGAFAGERLVGMATYIQNTREKTLHKGAMVAVYVAPDWRAAKLGRKLVERVIAHAEALGVMLRCTVTAENVAARRLYHSLGFLPYGLERDALCVDGRFLDEELLVLDLRRTVK
ncbi:GNAT family N-acetyltransferase [Mesorhizobium sp. AaZ16]|uniref:GNAT family N-acetyltransferase n=1 Tax=Mesorhizobium sp. AaZ16 TaxID=3402289 RepID=UPI00374E8D64